MSENDFEERLNRIKKLSDKLSKLNKSETDDIGPEKEEINLPESEENSISIDEAEEIEDNNEQIDEDKQQIEEEKPSYKSTKKDNLTEGKNDNTPLYAIIVILLIAVLVLLFNNFENNSNTSINTNPRVVEYNNDKNDLVAKRFNEAIEESSKLSGIKKFKYSVDGRTYSLPENEVQGFLRVYPNAQLIDETKDNREKQTSITSKKNENKINSAKPEPNYPILNYITGDNPYSEYYGPGIFHYEDKYSINVSANNKDILFNVINSQKNIMVRSVYIKANTSYTIQYIAPGTYYLSYISGDRWSNVSVNDCINGGFVNDLTFFKNDNPIIIDNQNLFNIVRIDSEDFRASQNLNDFPFKCG